MRLHEELGPRNTSISAIAERAGVQRLTVYRHFPDESAVFQACTAHWLSLNPPPDPADWAQTSDPVDRFKSAVGAFYDYYSRTRKMWAGSYRDVGDVPALQAPMAEVAAFMRGIADDLVAAFGGEGDTDRLSPTVRHVLHFLTWSELEAQGLPDDRKLDVVTAWLQGPAQGR